MTDYEQDCQNMIQCIGGGVWCCPPAGPNSSRSTYDCTCYFLPFPWPDFWCSSPPGAKCQYVCDAGYQWNGSACVPAPAKRKLFGVGR